MEDDQYEAQRQANIAANLALLQSLGLSVGLKINAERKAEANKKAAAKRKLLKGDTDSGYRPDPSPSPSLSPSPIPTRRSSRVKRASFSYKDKQTRAPHETAKERRASCSNSFIVPDDDNGSDDEAEYGYRSRRTTYQSNMLLRSAQRLGIRTQNPKTFGHIPFVPVGTWWATRMDCSTAAVHAPTVAGISGNPQDGCWSLALSGSYDDDIDRGERFTYTGSGGKKLSGIVNGKAINLRTAPQTYDQSFKDRHNASLLTSSKTGKPIRVIRGYKGNSIWSPEEGYIYSGLYICTKAYFADGLSGFMVCKYEFERLPNQDPLPIPVRSEEVTVKEDYGKDTTGLSLKDSVEGRNYLVEVVIYTKQQGA